MDIGGLVKVSLTLGITTNMSELKVPGEPGSRYRGQIMVFLDPGELRC